MNRLVFILCIISLLSVFNIAKSDEFCDESWACAGAKRQGQTLNIWVENKKAYPITLTLLVSTSHLKDVTGKRGKFEVTRVLEGYEKQTVLNLFPTRRWWDIRYRYHIKWTVGDMHASHDNGVRYLLPHAANKRYPIVQGYNGGFSHWGASKYALDFSMPVGTPVHAARKGTVVDVVEKNWRGGSSRRYAKYANYVVILHEDGTTGEYYHLAQWGANVKVGEFVEAGELIGYSGNTGFSSMPHLHFAVYKAKSHGDYQSIPVKFERSPRKKPWVSIGNEE